MPTKLTPMLEQYFEIKRQAPDAILFYRLGDFYEMFFEDAEKAAPILDLVLTARGKGQEHEAPMCGVPYHAADAYIAKLIKNGFRVALCDQVEDPAVAKGIVKREIVRIFTPGTATESAIVERETCYLLSLVPNGEAVGAAYLDVSTGDFFVTAYSGPEDPRLRDDVARFSPREAIIPRESPLQLQIPTTSVEPSMFEKAGAHDYLARHSRRNRCADLVSKKTTSESVPQERHCATHPRVTRNRSITCARCASTTTATTCNSMPPRWRTSKCWSRAIRRSRAHRCGASSTPRVPRWARERSAAGSRGR